MNLNELIAKLELIKESRGGDILVLVDGEFEPLVVLKWMGDEDEYVEL